MIRPTLDRLLAAAALLGAAICLQGCIGTVAATAIGVTGKVAGATVGAAGHVAGSAVGAARGGDRDER